MRALPAPSVLAVLLAALGVRLLHVWQMRDTLFFSVLMGDSRGYDAWAQQLSAGDWLGREVFYQAPLYPYFLGIVYALLGRDLLIVRLLQALLGALSCAAVGLAAGRLVSPRAGLLAGLMLAFYPPAIFFDGLLQKSVLDVLFVSVSLALGAAIITERRTPRWWLLLGVAMGALALTRENALPLLVVGLVWSYRDREAERTSPQSGSHGGTEARRTNVRKTERMVFSVVPRLRRSTLSEFRDAATLWFTLGVAAALLPVAIRNYVVAGDFYLTTSQFGSNLYIGNHPGADGSYVALREGRGSPEFERADATDLAEAALGRRLSPAEVSSYWTKETLTYVRSQPADWLRLLGRKAWLLFSSTEIIDTESQESHAEYSWPLSVLGRFWHFGVLLPLAVAGAIVWWPERRRIWPLYALTGVYAATIVLFFVVARYRLPLVPMIIVFAAKGLVTFVESVSPGLKPGPMGGSTGGPTGLTRAIRLAAIVALPIGVAANWPLHTAASQQAITENNLATALQESGRHDEAIAHYRRALELQPKYVPAMSNLGSALRAAGRLDEALATYEQALAGTTGSATTHLNHGNALMARGQIADAIAAFRRAHAIDPQSAHAATSLAQALYDQGTAALEAGSFEAAVAALREAIAVRSDYVEAYNNLGIALASQGNIRDAVTQWEAALRIKPDFVDARRNLEQAKGR